ncbi:glycosyl transferase [Alsobacter soli]|uniref:Glycosyl transferase n=1 Tax=Alsobacter soli TaxID=2109933 RepID=A0A2T1HY81_9HYPH|nr:glycosyltransferase family 2 protein [Alsobacter soli]PSC06653.1 glycosyl transferase [Alsobacter soli]
MTDAGAIAGPATAPHGVALPRTLEFLADCGVPQAHLRACLEEGARTGRSVDEVLLDWGLVEEDALYRALARRLGAPYLTSPHVRVPSRPAPAGAVMAPLAQPGGPRFALAPRGAAIELLVGRVRPGASLDGAAITSPSRLARSLRSALDRSIAHAAAHALPDAFPHLSCRSSLTRGQRIVAGAVAGLAGFAALLAPAQIGDALSTALGLLFLTGVVARLMALMKSSRPEPAPPLRDEDLPVYTILAPLLREARVLPQLVSALCALDYPREKLDIKLLIEANDGETLAGARALRLPEFISVVVCPPGRPQTKPRALNIGLRTARGSLLTIYDAEDIPDPDQLRKAAAAFARADGWLACLQARLAIHNPGDSWLTRLFALEYAALFGVLAPGYTAMEGPTPLGGTSNHFRVDVLRRVLGWDAWNVTEDADLGLRLARLGYRVGSLDSETREEAVRTLPAWMAQRTRWQKGWMQTTLVHARGVLDRRLALDDRLLLGAHTLGLVAAALGSPLFLAVTALRLWDGSLLNPAGLAGHLHLAVSLSLLALGPVALGAPILLGAARARLSVRWRDALVYPVYLALMTAASWRAVWELLTEPQRWNKTEHGLSRRAPIIAPPEWGARASLLPPQQALRNSVRRPWRTRPAGAGG